MHQAEETDIRTAGLTKHTCCNNTLFVLVHVLFHIAERRPTPPVPGGIGERDKIACEMPSPLKPSVLAGMKGAYTVHWISKGGRSPQLFKNRPRWEVVGLNCCAPVPSGLGWPLSRYDPSVSLMKPSLESTEDLTRQESIRGRVEENNIDLEQHRLAGLQSSRRKKAICWILTGGSFISIILAEIINGIGLRRMTIRQR